MTSRRKTWWMDEDGTPHGGWQEIPEDLVEDGTFPEEREALLYQSLEVLTPKQRFVIERSWGLGLEREYSFSEIAEAMGVYWTTVRGHYNAGMRRLRRDTRQVSP